MRRTRDELKLVSKPAILDEEGAVQKNMGWTVARLSERPLDVIGDVHGEFEALRSLLGHLGYDENGAHPDGRHAVFLGDFCDRGPDSPAVLDLVSHMVQAGTAQCVLGNHELNVILGAPKHGNGWFFDRNHDVRNGEFLRSKAATPEKRGRWLEFLEELPLALERDDLRVVHACWDAAAIHALETVPTGGHRETYERFATNAKKLLREAGIDERAAREIRGHRHQFTDRRAILPMLSACAEADTIFQNANPLRVLTGGLEAPAETPAWAGGKWRMTRRARWWREYQDEPAVIIGHYWRRDARVTAKDKAEDTGDPLDDYSPYEWMGPARNVFCVDYAVGGRYVERARGATAQFKCRLAAMRWPERELVFDDGERIGTGPADESHSNVA